MNNGFIKDSNNEINTPLIPAENISINNINLKDYISLIKAQLIDIINKNLTFKNYIAVGLHTLTSSGNYEILSNFTTSFLGRSNIQVNNNFISLTEDGGIKIENLMSFNDLFTTISFNTVILSNTTGNKFIKIRIKRGTTEEFVSKNISTTINANERGNLYVTLSYIAEKDDIIYIEGYGSSNDAFDNGSISIELQECNRNAQNYVL